MTHVYLVTYYETYNCKLATDHC